MDARTKGAVREGLAGQGFDTVTIGKDDVVTVRRSFFYRCGMSWQTLEDTVKAVFPSTVKVDGYDVWKAWPKTSCFVYKFRMGWMNWQVRAMTEPNHIR